VHCKLIIIGRETRRITLSVRYLAGRTTGPRRIATLYTSPKDSQRPGAGAAAPSPPQLLHPFLPDDGVEAAVDHADLVHEGPPDAARRRLRDACQVHVGGEVELQRRHRGVGLLHQVVLQKYLRHPGQYAECDPDKDPRVSLHNGMTHVLRTG
jgi:hypothetical protein